VGDGAALDERVSTPAHEAARPQPVVVVSTGACYAIDRVDHDRNDASGRRRDNAVVSASPKLDRPLESARLLLRPFVSDDLDSLYAIHSRADVARYLYWQPRTRDEVQAALEKKIRGTAVQTDGDSLSFAVVLKESSELVGDCVLLLVSREHRQGEIGFVFHPDHHGRGYATEAARLLLRLAFEELELRRVVGRLEARNAASVRVLERLGMRREAHFVENEFVKGEWQSELVYAILWREWESGSSWADRASR
jgi:RimJ/RimL family protein N-acetyltransferase